MALSQSCIWALTGALGQPENVTNLINFIEAGGGDGITALTGDVTATGTGGSAAATVAFVGGSSAANVHSAELLANAGTNLNTASTLVKRDSSGNFSAGTITASLTGHASLDLALAGGTLTGSLGIGGAAVASSALAVTSTTKGFLPPSMTTTQKDAISSPATGLVVYDSTLNKLSVFTGSAWETVTSS